MHLRFHALAWASVCLFSVPSSQVLAQVLAQGVAATGSAAAAPAPAGAASSTATAAAANAQANADATAQSASTNGVQTLGQVVVTATRGAKALDKIPGAVSVISRQEIDTQGLVSEDPSALLALQIPGYAPSRQKLSNFGEGLRGRNALLLLDGIPQTNPLRLGGREGYFADPMIVSRMEVVSGASAAQGMGATGGIINTITRRPTEEGTRQTVELKYGTQFHGDTASWKAGYMVEHKSDFDVVAYVGTRLQDIGVDGAGRPLATESLHQSADGFIKIGKDFGPQRLQLMLNRYRADGFDDRVDVPGDRATGQPTTSAPGTLAYDAPRNEVRSASLEWTHADLAQGAASLQIFKQDFRARYSGGVIATFQDASIAPVGTLVDQSEIKADKWGVRASWVRPDFWTPGLELTLGADYLDDESQQRLTQTDRVWVPPMAYRSLAPFGQLEYEWGSLTVRGGLRDEHSRLRVDDYSTLAYYGSRAVEGGERSASKLVKNLGAVWRFGNSGWSSFVSYNEGFGSPDVGLILRAVNSAGRSVSNLVDLQPILTDNVEVGVAWRGSEGSVSASVYRSHSDLGSQLVVSNGIGSVQRVPITVRGFEISGEWRPSKDWQFNGSYALTRGRTASTADGSLDLDLGARSQGPDKLVLGAQWRLAPGWQANWTQSVYFSRDANVGKFSGKTSLEEHFKGYTVADASVSWDSPWGQLGVGVENLFNRSYLTYYAQANYSGTADDYYAGRGRSLTLSWRRSF
ncbi:TonB-dependent receptor [Roseateles sp. SL47]|uniref:TonB-dependent receptor n=1 Tax=Roseateles sp. SL47 TaxID=2995138 RepID=UPI0022705C0E|nr:TonB-dependent receptor [Roseateles sp. SL47]WAC74740.1 TonB-dependent receptor [Roseateles sp. SL47]